MDCPKCGSTEYCKDGFANGRQRYKCKRCNYHYTVERRSGEASVETKQLALKMYLEGVGFRSIGRILGYSNVAVLYWIREFGEEVDLPVSEEPIEQQNRNAHVLG